MTDQEKIEALEAKVALLSVSLRQAEEERDRALRYEREARGDIAGMDEDRIAARAVAQRFSEERDAAESGRQAVRKLLTESNRQLDAALSRAKRLAEEREQACVAARDFEAGMRAARAEAERMRAALDTACKLAMRAQIAFEVRDDYGVKMRIDESLAVCNEALSSPPTSAADEVAVLVEAMKADATAVDERDARIAALEGAMRGVVRVIDCAGGPVQLSFAVQLGQMSWAAKLSDAIAYAQSLLSPAPKRKFDGDPMAPFESMTAEERADIESERGMVPAGKTEAK